MAGLRIAALICRYLLAAVFLLAGGLKLADPSRFLLDIQSFNVLPYPVAFGAAMLVPWLEVLGALALVAGRWGYRAALICLDGLVIGFIGILAYSWSAGLDPNCGCFGDWLVFPHLGAHIAFNVGLMLILDFLLIREALKLMRARAATDAR